MMTSPLNGCVVQRSVLVHCGADVGCPVGCSCWAGPIPDIRT